MPTLLIDSGFRFFFYSNENDEPIHVHVTKAEAVGKIWLEPETLIAYMRGFTVLEEKRIMQIVKINEKAFKQKWNEYFSK